MAANKKEKTIAVLKTDSDEKKQKALENALAQIDKAFGKGSVMKLGASAVNHDYQIIPTGILQLDHALGIGGVPRGRVIEVFGNESSGKTTIALHMAAQAQKMNGIVAFIDAEHALDPTYAKALGVNIDELYISQPDTGEQALSIAEYLVRSGAVDMIIVDSVAALVPRAEIEGEMGDTHVGLQARLMSQALRKLTGILSKSNTVAVFINQMREKVGGMPGYGGPNTTTTGGKALKFYATIRLEVIRCETLRTGSEAYGYKTKVKVVKNKVAPPFKVAEFDMIFGEGASSESGAIDLAIEYNIIQKSGSWFSYGEMRLGQGKDNVRKVLKDNQELFNEIVAKIHEKMESGAETDTSKEKEIAEAADNGESVNISEENTDPIDDFDDIMTLDETDAELGDMNFDE